MINFLRFFIIGLLFFSCAKNLTDSNYSDKKLPKLKEKELIRLFEKISNPTCETLYSKVNVRFKDENRQNSFKMSLRHIQDSALTANITVKGYPIASSLVNLDSLTLVNRINKCFIKSDIKKMRELLGVDIKFSNIEQLIYGRPIIFNENQKYSQINNPYEYGLFNKSGNPLNSKKLNQKDLSITYIFNDSATLLRSTKIISAIDSLEIQIDYLSYQTFENFTIPKEVQITALLEQKEVLIFLEFNKVEFNQKQELFINIPEKYESCN